MNTAYHGDAAGLRGGERLNAPGDGLGWTRLAEVVARELPAAEIDGIWVFRPIRNGPREWGTAIVTRVSGERRRIYTARYVLAIKGKERGRFESAVEEVGSGPVDALPGLMQEAARRTDEEEPPAPVEVDRWFPTPDAEAPPREAAEAAETAEPPSRRAAENGPPQQG